MLRLLRVAAVLLIASLAPASSATAKQFVYVTNQAGGVEMAGTLSMERGLDDAGWAESRRGGGARDTL